MSENSDKNFEIYLYVILGEVEKKEIRNIWRKVESWRIEELVIGRDWCMVRGNKEERKREKRGKC